MSYDIAAIVKNPFDRTAVSTLADLVQLHADLIDYAETTREDRFLRAAGHVDSMSVAVSKHDGYDPTRLNAAVGALFRELAPDTMRPVEESRRFNVTQEHVNHLYMQLRHHRHHQRQNQ